ncbi:hypothetical protein PF004_g7806 [Phytophthora fragariae]|uniref:Uncharacterized protein n=1 Tax=Phytophthora fragariae TaxID=53985 RepID=A0A6G0P8T7_9STRA|nr:hypothetical protein PF004_g7806 [Phytophthora fragariae]
MKTFQAAKELRERAQHFGKCRLIIKGMGDRTYGRDGRAPAPRRTTDFDERRRHDQQRLLVELELDDSLYQGTLQAGIEQRAAWYSAPDSRSAFAGESRHLQHSDYTAEPKTRVQSRHLRDPTAKPLTERQMQQLNAKRLSSPYKLKQQVLDIRNDSTSHRISHDQSHQRGSGGSGARRSIRPPTMQRSPAHLVMESIRQNMHLRDQVLAHLQQELMGVLPLHRASHVEKNVPQRVVKLLNRMRSLSLAVVEAVVYLSGELGDSNVVGQSVEHEVLEQHFFVYLLQMASDSDFLACSPQLQRFFEDFEVNLTRNPFVDGLSLDSSEVLLCSCHQSAESGVLFCSAASSPSSLLRLLRQKLETFALQTQRYLPGWQVIPAERVAAALLHLMDLETRFNAVRMIPRYLQSKIDSKRYVDQHRGHDNSSYGYGTFEDERIPRLDRQDSQASRLSDYNIPHGISVVEAWAGSPIPKAPVVYESRVLPSSAPKQRAPDQLSSSSKASNDSARGLSKMEENARRSSSAWIPMPTSPETISARTAIPAEADSAGNGGSGKVEVARLVLPPPLLDLSEVAKSSSRSSESERAAAKRRSSKATEKTNIRKALIDSGTQMSERSSPSLVVTPKQDIPTPERSARIIPTRSVRDEAMQVYQDESASLASERRPPVRSVREDGCKAETWEVNPDTKSVEDELSESVASLEFDDFASSNDEALFASSRGMDEGEASGVVDIVDHALEANAETVADSDDEYDCDFEYSSNEALSSIAGALRMLPNFTLSTTDSTLDDEVLKPEVAIPPNEYESVVSSGTGEDAEFTESIAVPDASASMSSVGVSPASTCRSVLSEVTTSTENVITNLESVEQRVEPEDDEYSYSSSTAISNIAMALSILPSAWRDNAFIVPEERHKEQSETAVDIDSSRLSTYRSLEDSHPSLDELRHFDIDSLSGSPCSFRATVSEQAAQFSPLSFRNSTPPPFDSNISVSLSDKTVNLSPSSSQSNFSDKARDQELPSSVRSDTTTPASSRSNISAGYSYQADDESEPSELNRIFALCRDIQVAAYDMSHWVSQREVEDHIQSAAQPFSALMGYSSPTATNVIVDSTPKYLERELKMLRRNFTSWIVFCVEQMRAKVVVRRLVARRKVRQFVSHHYHRRLQARIDEENRLRSLAASRIQWCWRVHRQNREILQRKAVFRALHVAFRRTQFFMGISKRRRVRECAKEKLVRWWRRQRSRIKKTKQREEKFVREKERRAGALKDIRRFLKEVLLRRKLKDAEQRAKNILFKEQLKWTKAKRDVERSMKINSKHRRELIADMNARLADLDRRWKTSEEERLQLLTHHERVVQQQQQAVEVRRRRLAALKIQMFFRVCCLHKKLQSVGSEKKKYETQLQEEILAKEKLDVETQRRVGKTRTQVRVLERKLGRMTQQALQTDAQHREVIQAHQKRERLSQERAARQKIKAFVDGRVLLRRAEHERHQLLLQQAYLQAEKTEIELMSSEDQLEQRRAAISVASDLQQRLSELEARSEALLEAKSKLEAEKEQEAQRAVAALEHSRVEASMRQIASWVSGQMQLSKLKKEQAAIRESAAHEMQEEKRRQRKEIGAMMREITSIKDSSFMHQRVSQYRNRRTVEMMRIQQQQNAAYEKVVAERTRAQLVQVIIAVKLLSESESSKGVVQALDGVTNFHKALKHKWMRLKYLRRMNSSRVIQRTWRREQVKRAEELTLAQLKLTERRQELARQIQAWWRQRIQQHRQEQEMVLQSHLEGIRVRANARKIQRAWRCWIVCERERRIQQQLAIEAHLEAIHVRVNRIWKLSELDPLFAKFKEHGDGGSLEGSNNGWYLLRTWKRFEFELMCVRSKERGDDGDEASKSDGSSSSLCLMHILKRFDSGRMFVKSKEYGDVGSNASRSKESEDVFKSSSFQVLSAYKDGGKSGRTCSEKKILNESEFYETKVLK